MYGKGFAVIAVILSAQLCFAQDNSSEMNEYANAVPSQQRLKAKRANPPRTRAEVNAAIRSNELFEYPSFMSRFGIGMSEGLARVRSNGKVGYIDRNGRIAIAAKFDEGGRFSEGLARVMINRKWGFIGQTGSVVIPPVFEWACSFYQGRALVKIGDKWGYIDKKGRTVISPRFDEAESFSEGLAAVKLYKGKYKTGYIDRSGKWILQPIYDGGRDFHEGVAIVDRDIGYNNGAVVESYVITRKGQQLFELTSWYRSSYAEGRLPVANKEGQFGFLDLKGRLVIPYKFDHASSFSEGLALVRIDNNWVYVDTTGNVVLRPEANCIGDFMSGRARCGVSGKWGLMDRSGKFVIAPNYDWVENFRGQLAAVYVGDKVGYVNRKGQVVWKPTN